MSPPAYVVSLFINPTDGALGFRVKHQVSNPGDPSRREDTLGQ